MALQQSEIQNQSEAQATEQGQRPASNRLLIFGGVIALLVLLIGFLSINTGNASYVTGGQSIIVLALPVFLVGVLSFMSPCTLPILPAYFAFTFQAQKQNIVLMTVAFFLGLATTMTLVGTTATALGLALAQYASDLAFWGGLIVIGFGVMSILGKGFAGPQVQERPAASVAGSYLYGATFALGWTACIGPILGGLFSFLATAQGIAVGQGAVLSFIYALGMGMPLILMSTFFSRMGQGSRFWRFMRGKSFEVRLPGTDKSLHLHSTSVISGVLLIAMGWLLASGHLEALTQVSSNTPLGRWFLDIETAIDSLFR